MGFIAQALKGTRNKLNVPHYCGHSCLIPTHWETRDHFQSVPEQSSTTLTSLHVDASMAPEAFFFWGTCAAWRNTKDTEIYCKHVLHNVNFWQDQINVQILGSRSRCRVPPVFCGASTLFSRALPSSCLPGLLYASGCNAPLLDAWALGISSGSQQTVFCAPSLVGPHDLEKTVPLIFSPSSLQLYCRFAVKLHNNNILKAMIS